MKTILPSRQRSVDRSSWRRYMIVVSEQTSEGWSAWFRDMPQHVCVGDSGLLAILTLIETHGSVDMDAWDMIKLDARSHDSHFEYLLPARLS